MNLLLSLVPLRYLKLERIHISDTFSFYVILFSYALQFWCNAFALCFNIKINFHSMFQHIITEKEKSIRKLLVSWNFLRGNLQDYKSIVLSTIHRIQTSTKKKNWDFETYLFTFFKTIYSKFSNKKKAKSWPLWNTFQYQFGFRRRRH